MLGYTGAPRTLPFFAARRQEDLFTCSYFPTFCRLFWANETSEGTEKEKIEELKKEEERERERERENRGKKL